MKVLKYLQNPSDLPWIIISQLILALAVAHFGAVAYDDAKGEEVKVQEVEAPAEETGSGDGDIYILKMGDTPDQCVVLSVDGTVLAQVPTAELDFASLDGRPVVDLSLSEDKQKFFIAISQKFQTNSMSMGIAYSK